jgi:glycosyltransferase involved in cell wall biosynthesis
MKIAYLINKSSPTSIPLRWAQFSNNQLSDIDIKTLTIKQLFSTIFCKIVHGHHIKAMSIFLVFNIFIRKKTVYTVHGSYLFLSKLNKYLLYFIFKNTDQIIFVNKSLYDLLPSQFKLTIQNKFKIILNGVETKYDYKKIDVYNKFKISENDIVLFHPARFVSEKNHENIIRAVSAVVKKNKRIVLVLAGDGALKPKLEKLIKELTIKSNVKMIGTIDRCEVYNFLAKCDLFLMPSISEGLNIAFLEAISMHARILVSNIDQFTYPISINDLQPRELNIEYVDPLKVSDIANSIKTSLQNEKLLSYDCSDFSLSTMMLNYKELYKAMSI